MLNAQELDNNFVAALSQSWDKTAIWSGCKDTYKDGIAYPSFRQYHH